MSIKSSLMGQINHSFGSGGMTSSLDNTQITEYIQYVQRAHNGPLPIKKAVLLTGRQSDGSWVLNAETFISSNGHFMSPSDSPFVWLDKDLVYEHNKIVTADICPTIVLPLSSQPLCDLFLLMESITKHNFIPTILVIAGIALSFHYEAIVDLYGGCPSTVALGESETGSPLQSVPGCHFVGVMKYAAM